jgi:hypothetical protein
MAKDASVTDIQQVSQQALVPITNPEEQARYYSLGMTYMSDNQSIIPRDLAGNILFEESALVKPLLIIEPVAEQITTISTLRVLDTAFQYYKFPVSVNIIGSVDVDFEIQAQEIEEQDSISTRYTIPPIFDNQNQPQTYLRINTSRLSTWFKYNDGNGEFDSGPRRLPFVGPEQQELGTYTITQNTLDTLRAKNQTLKFTIKTQFTSQNKTQNVGFRMIIGRAMPESWRSNGFLYELYTETKGILQIGEYPVLELEYVLDIINDAAAYDNYEINVVAGDNSWVLSDNCYWKIDVIDIPTTPSLTGKIGYGVYSFGNNSRLSEITDAGGTTYPIFEQVNGQISALGIYPDAAGNVVAVDFPDDGTGYLTTGEYFPFGFPGSENEVRNLLTSNTGQILGSWQFSDNAWVEIYNNEDANNTAEAPYPPFGEPGSYADEIRYFIDNNGDEITYIWRFDGSDSWSIYDVPVIYF